MELALGRSGERGRPPSFWFVSVEMERMVSLQPAVHFTSAISGFVLLQKSSGFVFVVKCF